MNEKLTSAIDELIQAAYTFGATRYKPVEGTTVEILNVLERRRALELLIEGTTIPRIQLREG